MTNLINIKLNNINLDLPLDLVAKNIMSNTQPDHIMKYKYIYGNHTCDSWTKVFKLPMSIRSFLFENYDIRQLKNAKEIKIADKKFGRLKILVPDLIFIVECENVNMTISLHVYGINNQFDPHDFSNIYDAPLPNLYSNGRVCQSNKISLSKILSNNILKNPFEICQYCIDMYLSSAFNSDLDTHLEKSISQFGYNTIRSFFNDLSNVDMHNKLKLKFSSPIYKPNRSLEKYISNLLEPSLTIPMLSEKNYVNDYIRYDGSINIDKIKLSTNPVCLEIDNFISIGDYIKFYDKEVRVLSFGPGVESLNSYIMGVGASSFNDDQYIKVMTNDYKIEIIYFSQMNDVEVFSYEKMKEEDYPENIIKNSFIITGVTLYRKILNLYKQYKGNNIYIEFHQNDEIFEQYNNTRQYEIIDIDTILKNITPGNYENLFGLKNVDYDHCCGIKSLNNLLPLDYIKENLVSYSHYVFYINNPITNVVEQYEFDYVSKNDFEKYRYIESDILYVYDNKYPIVIPKGSYFTDPHDKIFIISNEYIENDENLFNENMKNRVNAHIAKWDKNGKVEGTIYVINYTEQFCKIDLDYGGYYRLPLCDKNFMKKMKLKGIFYDDLNTSSELYFSFVDEYDEHIFVEFGNIVNIFDKTNQHSPFKSDDNSSDLIGKCFVAKSSTTFDTHDGKYNFNHQQPFKIIDIDTSHFTYMKIYTSQCSTIYIEKSKNLYDYFDTCHKSEYNETDDISRFREISQPPSQHQFVSYPIMKNFITIVS